MKKTALVVILAILLMAVMPIVMAPPPIPMTVDGYVFAGEEPAPELNVYAKYVNQTQVSNTTTKADGSYTLIIPAEGTPAEEFPPEGTLLDLWVENINVTRITLEYMTVLELNLTIPTLAPTVNFTGTPTSGVEPLTVQFTDTSMNFENITSWSWQFGDNTTSTEQNPEHTYTEGNYTVSLTVVGDGVELNLTETKVDYITVYDSEPAAEFYGTPLFGAPPLTVQFYDQTESYDGIVSRLWRFGDNTTGTEKNPQHTYTTEGVYTVSLNVTEADGDWDAEIKPNYVIVTANITGPVEVMMDVGSIHFPTETAEFYIFTLNDKGLPVNVEFLEVRLWFYHADEKHYIDLATPLHIEAGVYRVSYEIPENAPAVTYTLVTRVQCAGLQGMSYGGAVKSFQVSPTLTGWNASITKIEDDVATILVPGLTEIKANLTAINAQLVGLEGTVATINSTMGTVKTDVATINAKLINIEGIIATVNSTVGLIKTDVATINAKLVSINGTVGTIETNLGTLQGNVTDISGHLATVETEIGTISLDVSDLITTSQDVTMLVYVAIIFSILAFLAAVATLYMLRSKLA